MKICHVLFMLMLLIPVRTNAEDIIKKDEMLNLDRCIEIALKRHPDIIAAKNTASANISKIGQAQANYYPQITLSGSYSKVSSATDTTYYSYRNSVDDTYDQYTGSATLVQNIYDFGRTATQVKIQGLNYDGARSDLKNTTDRIIFNVKKAYYMLLQSKRNRDVALETVEQFEYHLKQARGFYEVGTKAKFDVTKAEVDLGNARLNLIKAENALRLATATLNNAMGISDTVVYDIEDNLSFQEYSITIEDAIKRANENRPDLRAIIIKKAAAEYSIDLAKKEYYPSLKGNATYNWSGEKFPLDRSWDIGATVSFPIFSGFLTKYQVEESQANLNAVKANEELLKQSILLDVQQAYLNLQEAKERISVSELTVRQAQENLDLANGRYAVGVGNPIEVTDATVAYSNAKTLYIQALYDYKIAHASIEKAMGSK